MPYFSLPKEHPKLSALKLILLYILEKKVTEFKVDKDGLQDNEFYPIAIGAIKKASALIKELSNGGGIRKLQQRENAIVEILSNYIPADYLSLKNSIIETCDKQNDSPTTTVKIMRFLNIRQKPVIPGSTAKQFLQKANESQKIMGDALYNDLVDSYTQLVAHNPHKTNLDFCRHLHLALENANIDQPHWGLTLLGRCIENNALLMANFLIQEGIGFEKIVIASTDQTALFCLARANPTMLMNIINNDPELVKTISAEIFYRRITYEISHFPPKEESNTSVFYWLTTKYIGHRILKLILKENDTLAKAISAESLCSYQTFGEEANVPALYLLATTDIGLEILDFILQQNSKIIKDISADVLCQCPTSRSDKYANTSALYWLAGSEEGQEILDVILKKNLDLCNEISIEELSRYSTAGEDANTSAFYWLASTVKGCKILDFMLQQNSPLAKGITGETLCRFPLAGDGANISALFSLSVVKSGRKILDLILQQNPNLAKEIPIEAICQCPTSGDYENISTLFWLALTPSGLTILDFMLQQNHMLAKGISAKELCKHLTMGEYANLSVLCCLAYNSQSRKILYLILQQNPEIPKGISAEALCLFPTSGKFSPISAFSYLAKNPEEGHAILHFIFQQDPKLVQDIHALAANRSEIASDFQLFYNTFNKEDYFSSIVLAVTDTSSSDNAYPLLLKAMKSAI